MDEILNWDPRNYENVTVFRIPIERAWTPDIFLANSANFESWNMWRIKCK